ncbi:RES family NAD+ phosphorylase [Aequorivita sp. SDUM287046]|uniref:RES family NAD+ phosphorylase n=1 Tax=Aequorivita aurantiaca TaxID=3053356 RepID=A0ABT8DGV8_9FLAO|nr:RES family NAD+ phosphorylase [Aequorivita aurantiaca]MDN3724636.1 RES family NAD+ phosphorylase [Aequorivita aurantiaca]
MRIYRISKNQYINDLSGEGSRLYGGRWNHIGEAMLYFSQNLSLSLLEILVHVDYPRLPLDYSFLEVEIPDNSIKNIQSIEFIEPKWSTEAAVNQLQLLGSNWLKKNESLAMKIPSAVLQPENNFLINPMHKDFQKLKVIKSGKLDLDPRLFRK